MEEISFMNGPCQILPASDEITTDRKCCVKLRIPTNGTSMETYKPVSVPGMMEQVTEEFPNNPAYIFKNENNKKIKVTYTELMNQIRICAKAFLHLGLEKHNAVCILGFNSPEWLISNMAAIFASGISCGIYTTNSPEACFHCANVSQANIIVVEDEKQCEKIQQIRSRLPHLKAVIQYSGEPKDNSNVLSWKELMKIGEQQTGEKLEHAMKGIAINQCCTFVFTSGTVGNPKAVMLSHDNLIFVSKMISERIDVVRGNETIVSYLPLSHIAAQVVDIYLVFISGGTIHFADKDALKGSLVKTLREARPTKFIGVPRVWEKIQEKILEIGAQSGALKKYIANWAKAHALEHNMKKMNRETSNSWGYTLASSLILKKIKQALGLDKCNLFASAAAPLSADVKRYFLSLDIPIMEAFGMSECGCHTLCVPSAFGLDTIGMPLPGVRNKIADPENGHGEICAYGRHVFMGYLDDPEKTREAIHSSGWLHTGDIGKQDERGFVYITGRLKELLITAGGENVPPVPIEQAIQAVLPNLSYAVLIGDRRKFLSLLVVLESEVDQETAAPTEILTQSVQNWLNELGCPAKTITEVLGAGPDEKLLKAIQNGIDKVNENATSNAQRIQKFRILPSDFSIATGELGPTMKIKRRVVLDKYRDLVDSMYAK